MKLNQPKEWFVNNIDKEANYEIGAGYGRKSSIRVNRRPDNPDFVTKHQVVQVLRSRIRGLFNYYRKGQEEGNIRANSWIRQEIKNTNKAIKLITGRKHCGDAVCATRL